MPETQSPDAVLLGADADTLAGHILSAVFRYEEQNEDPLDTTKLVLRVYEAAGLKYPGWHEPTARRVLRIADHLVDEGKLVKYKRAEMFPSLLRRRMKKGTGRVPRWASTDRDRQARAAIVAAAGEAQDFETRLTTLIERAERLGVIADRCPGGVFLSIGGLEEILNRLAHKG